MSDGYFENGLVQARWLLAHCVQSYVGHSQQLRAEQAGSDLLHASLYSLNMQQSWALRKSRDALKHVDVRDLLGQHWHHPCWVLSATV